MLLVVTRRLREAWEQQQTRTWRGGYDFGANVTMLAGKTLGVLGVGAIGGHSAQVGKAFGCALSACGAGRNRTRTWSKCFRQTTSRRFCASAT
jgi:phosphoglycerate dehydrogenase-like enzyme